MNLMFKLTSKLFFQWQKDVAKTLIAPANSNCRLILYMGDATFGAEHIYRQWVDELDQSGVQYVALFRHKRQYKLACQYRPNSPKAYAKSAADINHIIHSNPDLKSVLYTGNPGNTSQMMIYHHLKHIFIGHGDSEKLNSFSRMFRLYDEIWVAGEAHKERLRGIAAPDTVLKIVGRPQAEWALSSEKNSTPNDGSTSIGYFPTWEGSRDDLNYSSASIADEILNAASKYSAKLNVKLHPSTGARIKGNKGLEQSLRHKRKQQLDKFQFRQRRENLIDIFPDCTLCITDVSSVVSDWLPCQKPIFVFRNSNAISSKGTTSIDEYCYTFSSAAELDELLKIVVLQGNDYLKDIRIRASQALVCPEATAQKLFAASVREACL